MTGSWSVCPACGCVVANDTSHADWHEALASRLTPTEPVTGPAWAGDPVPGVAPITETEQAEQSTAAAILDAIVAAASTAHAPRRAVGEADRPEHLLRIRHDRHR